MADRMKTADTSFAESARDYLFSRRGFLSNAVSGLAGIGFAKPFGPEVAGARAAAIASSAKVYRGMAQFAPKAKRVLQIFCPGGASHVDLWEHKPELDKR